MKNLDSLIQEKLKAVPGKTGIYVKDLVSGWNFQYRAEERFAAASVIKLPVLLGVCRLLNEGKLKSDKKILLKEEDKLPPSGVLTFLHNGLEVTIWDLCTLMIIISDNTATNILLKITGLDLINDVMNGLGLTRTRVNRLLFDKKAQEKGLQNYFTPLEIGRLLEQLWRGQAVSPEWSARVLDLLKKQQINHKIPCFLPEEVEIAHKTGEDERITHDVGIIYADNPFIICCAAEDTEVQSAEKAIGEIALACFLHFNAGR